MFELEILDLLKSYKKGDEYEKKKIEFSIKKLISEHKEEFEKFIETSALDIDIKKLLIELSEGTEEPGNENEDDFSIIKNNFTKWEQEYERNGKIPTDLNEKIIADIISFYITNRFEVLEQVLTINDTENFEAFKNMLKNYIRRYYAEKIEEYYESENFKNLGYFKKRRKKQEILDLLEDVGAYKFKPKKIEEAIQ